MIVGTAGHIDHGKTALVRALTGVDTDRLKEEKARGISIDLGFAYLHADSAVLGFVDVPGHERFIRNMLAGATGIDFMLLVVAADDGVMPQTIEHLAIVDLLGIEQGLVALTKTDLVAASRREEVAQEIKEELAKTHLASAEIVPVSAATGEGIDALREKLLTAARRIGDRAARGRFRLAVDRSFTLAGAGTVVTGTVSTGTVAVGDHVMVSPSGLTARVRSIHAENRPAERGRAGQRCALNLAGDGISKSSIARGDVVLDPALHAPADRIDAALQVLASEPKAIEQWMPVRLYHAAAEVGAHIALLETAPEPGGEKCYVQLVLERSIAAAVGDRFILRDGSAQRTVGGGRFLDLRAPGRKRRTPERRAQLDACAIPEPERALFALLERAPFYVNLTALARDRALAASEFDPAIERAGAVRVAVDDEVFVLSRATRERSGRSVQAALSAFHAAQPGQSGLGFEPLRLKAEPRVPKRVFAPVLQMLAREGEIVLEGALARLPSHQAQLSPADEKLWARVMPLLSEAARFRPPRVGEIAAQVGAPENEVRRLLKSLSRMGRTDEVAPDHFFLRDTVAEMVEIAAGIAAQSAKGQFSAAQFRDRLDNGRKVAIQILEFFDRHSVTQRLGDLRRMNAARLGLYRRPGAAQPRTSTVSGGEPSPVGRPDFKSGRGRQPVFGGFDSHSLPPRARKAE